MVRVKTEAKRAEVVAAAVTVFMERGYDRTSMEDIRERAGCSKGTLYSYFPSKDDLFVQALLDATAQEASNMVWETREQNESASAFLQRFGVSFLKTLYAPRFQALRRLAFSTPTGEVGSTVYEQVVKPYETRIAGVLTALMSDGKLRQANAGIAAHHFGGLLESELLLKFLLRAVGEPTEEALEAAASRAVTAFLAAYGQH
ncbi:TetR family transcriptional regulator [Comamonas sp. BIGb0124]|uniref:TetR/AcrR family transcriptional regulator n=1 Tax=Comamonas sp. BIGb0124 TaxID=2485130 RepID=UPI000F491A63|nr:TetR/AcrR family transcriptional regulator [Comamonas sp. BIGb0124]ROR23028.1 TetR family transcriptional regulator [Comamonas sp. BIGb0124]